MSSYTFTRRHFHDPVHSENNIYLDSYAVGEEGGEDCPPDSVCAAGLRRIFNIRTEDRIHGNLPYRLEFVTTRVPTKESVPLSEIIAEWSSQVSTDEYDDEGNLSMFGNMVEDYDFGDRHVTCYILPDKYPDN
ncbi:hypothetical protein KC963_00615 [Candidatus Saccharibacteria bacterium]|nr:hypothetical protein [Candidatus Saccharibacteria bacterium]